MSDRRTFLKQAGMLSVTSLPDTISGKSQNTVNSESASLTAAEAPGIVLENAELRLVISSKGCAESLVHKATGQECLVKGTNTPFFTVTQYLPYDNEIMLANPAKVKDFPVEHVRRDGDRLIVTFATVGYEASIRIKTTDAYVAFQLEKLIYKGYTSLRPKSPTPIDESVFVQLPVRDRKNLGEWLNVVWDDAVAVNLLATDPFAKIDAEPRQGYHLFRAGTVDAIRQEGVGAALIVTHTPHLLDRIARVEEDFDLPCGVESRRRDEYKYSYYEVSKTTPAEIDQHIHYAKLGGFRLMDIYYYAFAKSSGHFPWRPEYPGGMTDVQGVVSKVSAAGIIPGIHIHYNKAHKNDAYVTPVPDRRLNIRERFTLAESIDRAATTITVDQNPRCCTMDDERRILKVQNELITYQRYSTAAPFRFEGCERGALGTEAAPHETGTLAGILDVDTWPVFVRFTQDTDIQEETAERLRQIYAEAGFKFVYYDGAEDVPPPYWYTVSWAQWIVQKKLNPQPLFGEGACRSHFSWHILTRGNAFDIFKPEVTRQAIQAYPAEEIKRMKNDFTSINFGWIGYWSPSNETIGTQPDIMEYVTSRAAAWDCPVSFRGDLRELQAHPRTPDNLEVLRRWEDVRAKNWLTEERKSALRNLHQEHLLLVNERGEFELVPCNAIEHVAGADRPGRAFVFERQGNVWVTYWHMSGEGTLEVPLAARRLKLMRELGKPLAITGNEHSTRLPLGERRFLECRGVTRQEVITAFRSGKLV